MRSVVVRKLRNREEFRPIGLPVVCERSEILLQLLVDTFRLSIGLRMESGRQGGLYPESTEQCPEEVGSELRSAIADHLLRSSVELPNVV